MSKNMAFFLTALLTLIVILIVYAISWLGSGSLFSTPTTIIVKDADDRPQYVIALSKDARLLAYCNRWDQLSEGIVVEDLFTKRRVAKFVSHGTDVHTMSFSDDGKTLAIAGMSGTTQLWDVQTAALQATFATKDSPIVALAFSNDKKILATSNRSSNICLWDIEKSSLAFSLKRHIGQIAALSFSPDDKFLAVGGGVVWGPRREVKDTFIELWDVKRKELVSKLQGHTSIIQRITFSPDGKLLASGSRDQTIRLWDTQTGQTLQTFSIPASVSCLAFNRDGTILAAGGGDINGWVMLVHIDPNKGRWTHAELPAGVVALAFPDDSRLTTVTKAKDIHHWDVESGDAVNER